MHLPSSSASLRLKPRLLAAVLCAVCSIGTLLSQNETVNETNVPELGPEEMVSLQFPTAPDLSEILLVYEMATGMKILREASIEGATLSIQTTGDLPRDEAVEFIEKSLLLNGYVLVPSGPKTMKLMTEARSPRSEEVPVITRMENIPEADQLITFIVDFANIPGEEAQQALEFVAPPHSYGNITVLPNGQTLAITENSALIRKYLALKDYIDAEPEVQETKSYGLERADAEKVVEDISVILGIGEEADQGGNSSRVSSTAPRLPGGPQANGNQPAPNNVPTPTNTAVRARPTTAGRFGIAMEPKLLAITRTNRVMAVAHPSQQAKIAALIEELDAPADEKEIMTRELNHLKVADFIEVAREALLIDEEEDGASGAGGGSTIGNTATRTTNTNASRNTGNFGNGIGSTGGLGGSIGTSASVNTPEENPPLAVSAGSTFLIANPAANEIHVMGPPEKIQLVNSLIDKLDVKPRQIQLVAVIGTLTLTDNFNFGIDVIRTIDQFNIGGQPASIAGSLRNRSVSTDNQGLSDPLSLSSVDAFLPVQSGLSIFGTYGDNLNVYLDALQSKSEFTVLDAPRIFTANNKLATIINGQSVPVPTSTLTSLNTGTANPSVSSSIGFEQVALQLDVVPLINSDGDVTLEIRQQNRSVIGTTNISGNDVPNIATQELSTTVTVPNRSTVMLGGLISEDDSDSQAGLPFLLNVPVLKHLAGSTSQSKSRSELLIFIQPTIIGDDSELVEANVDAVSQTKLADEALQFAQPNPLFPNTNTDTELPSWSAKPAQQEDYELYLRERAAEGAKRIEGERENEKKQFWKGLFRKKEKSP